MIDHERINLPTIQRVYFIGAGFSAGAGYPVGSTLLPRLINWLRRKRFRKQEERNRKDSIIAGTEVLLERFLAVNVNVAEASRKELNDAFGRVNVAEFYSVAHALADMPDLFGAHGATSPQRGASSGNELPTLFEGLSAATYT